MDNAIDEILEMLDSINARGGFKEYNDYSDLHDAVSILPCNDWISVDDALPEKNERVLVYCDDPFDIPPHFPRRKLLLIGYLDMENNWYDSDGPLENITHWMPLPKPPVVEVKDDA